MDVGIQADLEHPRQTRDVLVETDAEELSSSMSTTDTLKLKDDTQHTPPLTMRHATSDKPFVTKVTSAAENGSASRSYSRATIQDDATDTDTDWQDARESVTGTTPTASVLDFHSVHSKLEPSEEWMSDDNESVKTSRAANAVAQPNDEAKHRDFRDVALQTEPEEVSKD